MRIGRDWLEALRQARQQGEPCVLVTIAGAAGSTPRLAGTKMVVFRDGFAGTVGGGNLEFRAQQIAREMLAEGAAAARLEDFPLGPALGQCCGGHTRLLFEPMRPEPTTLLLFGAGHVGQALVPILADLPIRVRWIDSRGDLFPDLVPPNVSIEHTDAPEAEVEAAPPGAFFLVMTYSHDLDLKLVEAALKRGDAGWVGLIGSDSKRARFDRRLAKVGLDPARLVCPIGIPGIGGKHPKEIAVAVAAQLLIEAERVAVPA
ncbi:MAG: xanthine dehydrogenase accessory protein XdhC [Alphaproteobacteria bacterium]|jgi:xanthine dehydrogenase accessory factor|nr:xanthine dehydrogenase accessory protein XdhC [Alphaproteobacteria bacterium]